MKEYGTKLNGEGQNMPDSSPKGKAWIDQQVVNLKKHIEIKTVYDLGAGSGTYKKRYQFLLKDASWTAFEVWPKYITDYRLETIYDDVKQEDIRNIDFKKLSKAELVFAGDVLEHMSKAEAIALVNKVLDNNKCLMVSIPIVHMPQGAYQGNPYEEHIKDDWSDREMHDTFGGLIVSSKVDDEIGVYLMSKDPEILKLYENKYGIKIAIYTITKNEAQHVERWSKSNQEADIRLVCDTGSSDETVKLLKEQGVTVIPISVMPWRFDIARNTALNLLPADVDVCIWQDLDEELLPGWREQLETNWAEGVTIANHRYRNNNNPWQWHSKIHARHNCRWVGPVHETLDWFVDEHAIWLPELYLDEHQDVTKDRKSYLNLLLKKIAEGDDNWRTYYFLANDYVNQNQINEAIDARKKSYDRAVDEGPVIRSYVARNIAKNYLDLGDRDSAYKWLKTSVDESDERENWFFMADYFYSLQDWDQCYIAAKKCISITTKRDGFTNDERAWGHQIFDYASLSAYNIGLYEKAVEFGKQAVELCPNDERLKTNLNFFLEKANG